ncbi:MAG: C69 family dipeptidase [Candidatus Aminicenantes bacterium]|jgi:dipeptidase
MRRIVISVVFLIAINVLTPSAELFEVKHCTGVYVGKNLTADGSVLLGQLGDECSSHWIEVIPHRFWEEGAVLSTGVTTEANFPGVLTEIPQLAETNKYLTVRYSEYKGFPPPLENGGLNEFGVSVVDVWSPSRSELQAMTPKPQRGLSYSDEARIMMERAKTAREAVEVIGRMIDQYGHATFGGNVHLVADPEEGWIIEEFAGGQGLWAAKRLGPYDILVIRPGYLGDFPLEYKEDPDFMGSDNLISFALEQGWYDPESGRPFNISEIYESDFDETQTGHQRRVSAVIEAEQALRAKAPNITLRDVMEILRDQRFLNRATKYGQVAQLRKDIPNELSALWIAVGSPAASVYIPYYLGISNVPLEYMEHRYLTKGEALKMELVKERQSQEATAYAFRLFDRLFMLADEHFDEFHPEVIATFRAFEDQLVSRQEDIETIALQLLQGGRSDLAQRFLTYYCQTEALKGLRLARVLADSLEARTRLLFGIRSLPSIRHELPD